MRGSRWPLVVGLAAASLVLPAERSAAQPLEISPELRAADRAGRAVPARRHARRTGVNTGG